MDENLNKYLNKDNKMLILRDLLGFNFKLAKSIINREEKLYDERKMMQLQKNEAPRVSIEDGEIKKGQFSNISSAGEGLIYVTQTTENPGVFVIIVSLPSDSAFKKKRSTKKTPKRKKRSTKKTPKRNPRRV